MSRETPPTVGRDQTGARGGPPAQVSADPRRPDKGKTNAPRQEPGRSRHSGEALKLGYENALRMLDRDAEILDQLRTRANMLLAALAIGGAVLGAVLPSLPAHHHLPAWLVVLLSVAIAVCVGVQWPVRDHGSLTIASGVKPSGPADRGVRQVGKAAEPARNVNGSGGEPPPGAWKRFKAPWQEWRDAFGQDQRLWKTGLGREDMGKIEAGASSDAVSQTLLEIMYAAHLRNNGTVSRRADVLRMASILVFAFVIGLAVWLG